jgi:hypothetical protein
MEFQHESITDLPFAVMGASIAPGIIRGSSMTGRDAIIRALGFNTVASIRPPENDGKAGGRKNTTRLGNWFLDVVSGIPPVCPLRTAL